MKRLINLFLGYIDIYPTHTIIFTRVESSFLNFPVKKRTLMNFHSKSNILSICLAMSDVCIQYVRDIK